MVKLPDIPGESALSRLFETPQAQAEATWFSLPGGSTLYEAGDPADKLYVLRAGRLGAFRKEEGQEPQFLGVIRPGEPAGEMGLIAGSPHSAHVVALRDSEILCLPRDIFFDAAERDPAVMTELARLMLARTRQGSQPGQVGEPSVFGFTPVGDVASLRPLVERIAIQIGGFGHTVEVVGKEAAGAPTEWFSELERRHDFVFYVAEAGEFAWSATVARQVDRLFRVGRGDRPPPPAAPPSPTTPRLTDLILVHPRGTQAPKGSEAWLDALEPARLFHLRREDRDGLARLARVITGRSVGVVFSGGGARAYAHIGAIRALRARKVPIDFVCGASMGAIIGAGVAMGWTDAELDGRIREAFVKTSPLDDMAFPILAMTRGEKVKERLQQHFGDTRIADLWLPFFCVSSNLTTGAYFLHRRGGVVDALRATVALPGVLPPRTDGNNVLVDGAVLKNLPTDVMRAQQAGPIVGIDVTRGRSITADDVARPETVWRWLRSGQWRKGPPIVSLLMRAATVSGGRDLAAAREAADLLITPDVGGVEIRDWEDYDPAVTAGYRATIEALDKLTVPVTELRRRREPASVKVEAAPVSAAPARA